MKITFEGEYFEIYHAMQALTENSRRDMNAVWEDKVPPGQLPKPIMKTVLPPMSKEFLADLSPGWKPEITRDGIKWNKEKKKRTRRSG